MGILLYRKYENVLKNSRLCDIIKERKKQTEGKNERKVQGYLYSERSSERI